ncbi:fibronectin type III domain-containing protein [bacterium]|nr:fibronectin type III domain-containing protein [bacterium]
MKIMKRLMVLSLLYFFACLPVWAYDLSGTIIANNVNGTVTVGSITVSLSGAANKAILTSPNGTFSFTGLGAGTYTIIPEQSGLKFTPGSITCTITNADVTGVAFTASKRVPSLSIISPTPGEQVKSNGTVTARFDVQDFSLTATGDEQDRGMVAEGSIAVVLWKETLVGNVPKREPWMGFFHNKLEYTFNNLTPGTYTIDLQLVDMFHVRLPAKASVTFGFDLKDWAINPVMDFSAQSNNDSIRLKWQNPPVGSLKGVLILRGTSSITGTQATGTTYTVGETIGNAAVVYNATATSYNVWQETHVDNYPPLPLDQTYYYAIFCYKDQGTMTTGTLTAYPEYSPPVSTSVTLTNIPPSQVTDLDSKYKWLGEWYAMDPTDHSIILNWTSPGGDGTQGVAGSYTVKHSTSPITEGNFDSYLTVPGIIPTPSEAGGREHMVVIDNADLKKPFGSRTIQPETQYYFALKASDGVSLSSMSNLFPSSGCKASGITKDMTSPGTITDLGIVNPTSNSLMLVWTSPGDDGTITWYKDASGHADKYDIRYSTSSITEANWAYAKSVSNLLIPSPAGQAQVTIVSGLSLNAEEYYFGIKTLDEAVNTSGLSNIVSMDKLSPGAITDLSVGTASASTIDLSWTVPGDNGSRGTVTTYDIRYSTAAITESNWGLCTEVFGEPSPLSGGKAQTFTVTGLKFNTKYYFCLKAIDDAGNISVLSNCKASTTTGKFPAPPGNLAAIAMDSQLILNWSPTNVPDVGGYLVYYGTISCSGTSNKQAYNQPVDAGNSCTYTLTGLVNDTTYYISVRAYNTNQYPSDYSMEITGEPLGMGYQFLPQSVIIPMGIQQAETGSPLELDQLRNAYKAVFGHVKSGGGAAWTASNALPYDGTNYMRGTFISEFSSGSGTTFSTSTAMGTLTGFDIKVSEPGVGMGQVLGVTKSYALKPIKIAVFYSGVNDTYGQPITWEYGYFERLFRMYLWDAQEFTRITEAEIGGGALKDYDMVIFPAVKKGYMPEIKAALTATGLDNIKSFVEAGGFLYSQGESNYIAEMAGLVGTGTVDLNNRVSISDSIGQLRVEVEDSPVVSARLSNTMYVLDDPMLAAKGNQTTVAIYINVFGNPPAIVTAECNHGKVILMGGHPADKREYYPLALNSVLWAMSQKAALACDGEQRFNETVEKDIIPGLEADVPVHVTMSFSNFWNQSLQNVEVSSIVQKGFRVDETSISPTTTPVAGTDGTTILKWTFDKVSQGRLSFCYTVLTEANALKKGEAIVCQTMAVYTDEAGNTATVHTLPVKMRAQMAARLVGDRALEKQSVYAVSGAGVHFDVKFPIENKEDTEARTVYIQDLVALVSPAIDPTNYRRIPSAVWNTNNGNNNTVWIQNEAYLFQDDKYPLPAESEGDKHKRFNINNWDGETTYVFEQPEGNDADIVIPERYKLPVWGKNHNVPLIRKTETGDLILPAFKLTWPSLAKGTDGATIQGYDYLDPAIRYGIRAIELPPDGVEYSRTILMKTLPNIPEKYMVNGKVIMDAPALGFMILLGGDPIPYRELLASSGAYAPRVTDPADIPMLTYQDIWDRPHTATLRTMDPQYAKVSDFFPTVKLHPEVNDTFELFDDTDNDNVRDSGERLFLEYDITKKAKLRLVIKTGNISTDFPDVVKPKEIYNLSRDQNVITCSVFKGLGYNLEYGSYKCDDLQGIGNPTQLVREFDTDMFHVLQFQQRLDAGKREQINVYATMTTYPDVHKEGFMKVNDGTEYVYHTPKAGPNQYQIFNAHVQGVFGIGNNVEVTKKVAPVNIGSYGDTLYHIIKVEDPYEPRQFEMDPYLRSYGFGGLASTIFVGGRENDQLYSSRLRSGGTTIVRIEVCNNLGMTSGGKPYHLENVSITPATETVPSWMSISRDVLWNTIPPIHGDLVYLLASPEEEDNPDIYESWKGVIYFKVTTGTIPPEDQGKVHKIKFKLTSTDPDGKLSEFCNLPENTTKSIIPEAWIGIYDNQDRINTTYGTAKIETLKDGFPDFVRVKEAKLMTEEEKVTFEGKMGWDVDQPVRGTSSSDYFDGLAGRDIGFTQSSPIVVFNMNSIADSKIKAATVPWLNDGTETKTFYVVVKSDTSGTVTSGIKTVNTGANIEYTDHFDNTGTAASTAQTVVTHGPRVEMGYILDGVRRGFNQVLTKELIMGEKNDVELRITLSNAGDDIAKSTQGSVTLGSGVTMISSVPASTGTNGDTIIWSNLGDIAPGAVREIKMIVAITPAAGNPAPPLKAAQKKSPPKIPPKAVPVEYTLINTTGINFKDSFTGKDVVPAPKGSLTIMAAPALLTAPTNLAAVGKPGSVTLTWGTVTAAKGYNVYRSNNLSAGTFTHIAMLGTMTSYIDATMDEDIPYYYVVTAVDGADESQPSGTASAVPGDIWSPNVVILKAVTTTENSVNLAWTAPGDNGDKGTAAIYDLRRSASSTAGFDSYSPCDGDKPWPMKAGSSQGMTIAGLQPNTTYYFYLKSQDEVGNWSVLSNKLIVTTNAVPTISTSTKLSPGWNLYSLPLKPSTNYTSQSLGAAINSQGGKCTIVQSWQGGAWKTRRVDIGIGDLFNIEIGKGYFVYCDDTVSSNFAVTGVPVKTQQLRLVPGWNLIGLPVGTMSGRLLGLSPVGTISGRLLGNDILYQGGTCTTIQSWQGEAWKTLRVDLGLGEEFDIEPGKGYFVYANEGSVYSPNRITLSNVGSTTAAVSFVTWDSVSSSIRYGTSKASLTSLVYDIRGENSPTTKHYIPINGLAASTTYYYDIITSGSTDDNNGEHYSLKTGVAISPAASRTISGSVKKVGGNAEDAIVYVRLKDTNASWEPGVSAWISTQTNSSGNFSVDINTIRRLDGIGRFSYSPSGDTIEVVVDGNEDGRVKCSADTSTSTMPNITIE